MEPLGPTRQFDGTQSGIWVSDLFPHIASITDEISVVKSCKTELQSRTAKLSMNTRRVCLAGRADREDLWFG